VTVDSIKGALERYLFAGIVPGHTLTAILSNNLTEALMRADEETRENLLPIVLHLYNELPGDAWGSPEKVKAWRKRTPEEREASTRWMAPPA
jgi:hypothetical protein